MPLQTEKSYGALLEYALDAVFLTSPEGTILYANPAACALFGYTLDEFRTLGRSAVVDPSDPELSEALEQRHRTGSFSGTLRMLRKDKSPFTAELSSAVFTDADGELRTGIFIRDITERKQTEERLKESLSLKRATLESTADGILVVNSQGKVVDFNSKFTELWNIPPDLMEQKDDNLLIQHVLDQLKYPETFVLKVRELYNKPDDESFDEIPFKDGRIFERYSIPHRLEGKNVGRVWSFRDVTERKRVEQALHLTQFAIDRASIGCFWIMRDSRMSYVNDQACRSLGYTREELLNRSIPDIDPEFPPEMWNTFWQNLIQAKVLTFETTHQRKNGSLFPVEVTASYVAFGEQEYSCAFVRDISSLKQAEQALRESEERLRAAIGVSQIGIFDHDQRTDTIYWSPQQRVIHGWGPDEPITLQAFFDLVYPEDRERILATVRRAHDPLGDGIWDVEHRIIRRDGTVRWLKERSQTFFEGKGETRRPVRTVGAVLDVTERRRSEEEHERLQTQLFQAQKMESIGQLAGGVAHDFNNILTAIIGYGSILQMKMSANDPLRVNVDQILKSAGRAAQLTNSLLAFSRKQVLNMKPTPLNGIITGQEQFLRRIIGEDIDMKTIFHSDPVIMADNGQMEQVLMNLATNARDAMPKGGQLTIETDLMEMTDAFISNHGFGTPDTYAVISVTDTGIGMDEKTKQKIFEPFFTTKEVGRGTGLGMAIVYGIVKQHKGYINFYSKAGMGTTFKIYLPIYSGQGEQREQTIATSPVMTGTETILLAEDDATLRAFFRDLLTEYGYTVVIAEDGEEAIRRFAERKDEIQVCVIDMIMPKKSGKDVYDEIQRIKSGTKVIFSSGYTADKVQQEGLPAGSQFIAKPAPPQEFLSKIREVLNGYVTK
jgi:two-component system, cell cycle sensor histidine kinase and response regulator CckA